MEDSMNKIMWVVVSLGVIGIIYFGLKKLFPNVMNKLETNLNKFIDSTFQTMFTGGTGNDSGNK